MNSLLKSALVTSIVVPILLQSSNLGAQNACNGPNLLTNRSFETPVVPVINGPNNIINMTQLPMWNNYSSSNRIQLNIIRMISGTYAIGPDTAAHGLQYIDLLGSTSYMD